MLKEVEGTMYETMIDDMIKLTDKMLDDIGP